MHGFQTGEGPSLLRTAVTCKLLTQPGCASSDRTFIKCGLGVYPQSTTGRWIAASWPMVSSEYPRSPGRSGVMCPHCQGDSNARLGRYLGRGLDLAWRNLPRFPFSLGQERASEQQRDSAVVQPSGPLPPPLTRDGHQDHHHLVHESHDHQCRPLAQPFSRESPSHPVLR